MIKAPQQLLFLVSGVSFLTLLVNGWTSAPLLERLEMTIPSEDTVHLRAYAKRKANAQAARTYRRIIGDYGFVLGDAPGEPASPKKDLGATASSRWSLVRGATQLGVITEAMNDDVEAFGEHAAPSSLDNVTVATAPAVLERMRSMFLRSLKAEYSHMIELGLIPKGSTASQVLPMSCDIAMDHVATDLRDFAFVAEAGNSLPAMDLFEDVVTGAQDALIESSKKRKKKKFLNSVELHLIRFLQLFSSSSEDYYVLLAFHAGHVRTRHVLDEVFAYFVRTKAFAVDARDAFHAEVDAQLAACVDAMGALVPPKSRRKVDALLVAEVHLDAKHDVYVHLEEHGLINTKDRDILCHDLMHQDRDVARARSAGNREFRRESSRHKLTRADTNDGASSGPLAVRTSMHDVVHSIRVAATPKTKAYAVAPEPPPNDPPA